MQPATQIFEACIDDIHGLYRRGALTPAELVECYLAAIGTLDLCTDEGPPLNCIVCVSPAVREDAAAAGADILRSGVVKLLQGIPVWVKDNVDVQGLPTTGGSLALAEGVAAADAPLVRNLRAAGALIMGKVGMTELSIGVGEHSSFSGRIGNAVDARNRPGGSSNGSAVAVASNFGMLAVGVDDCGSITDPAAANSCVGLRPTPGLVSREGLLSFSVTETTPGAIARTVGDAARLLDALVVPNSQPSWLAAAQEASATVARVGVLAAVAPIAFLDDVAESVRHAFAQRLRQLQDAGVTIVPDVRIEGFQWRRQSMYEHFNSQVGSLRRRTVGPRTPRQLFTAPTAGPLVRRHGRHPLLRFGPAMRVPNLHALSYRREIRDNQRLVNETFDRAGVDVVITVTSLSPSRIATLAQLPHLTIPAGSVMAGDDLAARGFASGSVVPWGLSILGRPGGERGVLSVGAVLERMLDGRVRPAGRRANDTDRRQGLDIAAFNSLKRTIAARCGRSLQLDPSGQGYAHPTGGEFRDMVRAMTANAAWMSAPLAAAAAAISIG